MTVKNYFLVLVCATAFYGCKQPTNQNVHDETIVVHDAETDSINNVWSDRIVVPGFDVILDSNQLEGSMLFYDVNRGKWLSNDFKWAEQRRLPASTFKIVNSIIGLETGQVVTDKIEFKWDGKKRRLKQWEQDFDLKGAFHASCVPCYQDLAKRIGVEQMNAYLDTFEYGQMIVDAESLNVFWLEGESGVSQIEQVNFLTAFYNNTLPISMKTTTAMKSLMVIDQNDAYTLSGKTGWSIRNGNNNGWFVGYIEKGDDLYFFATNVNPESNFNMDLFPKIRSAITMEAFKLYMDLINNK